MTGFASAKFGRLIALTVGGAVIFFELAYEQEIIKIDWSRLCNAVDEAGDKIKVRERRQLTACGICHSTT